MDQAEATKRQGKERATAGTATKNRAYTSGWIEVQFVGGVPIVARSSTCQFVSLARLTGVLAVRGGELNTRADAFNGLPGGRGLSAWDVRGVAIQHLVSDVRQAGWPYIVLPRLEAPGLSEI